MRETETDFGWRYKGRWIGVQRDHSRDGTPRFSSESEESQMNRRTLACLQCGVCTATCHLADDNSIFPRREMSLVQSGHADRAAQLHSIWQCYRCDDCTNGCPSLAKPSQVMALLRAKATTEFSILPGFSQWLNTRNGFTAFFVSTLLIMGMVGIHFINQAGESNVVVYSAIYPHYVLISLFSGLILLSAGFIFISLFKAWRTWCSQIPGMNNLNGRIWVKSFKQSVYETVRHTRFAACDANRYRRPAHLLIVVGFTGLCGIALFAAISSVFCNNPEIIKTPFTAFKMIANLFSWLLIAGIGMFLFYHISQSRRSKVAVFEDWILPALMLVVALSGLLCQWLRWANAEIIAYIIYILHISSVFVLIVSLPFAKPAHALYRFMVEIFQKYCENEKQNEALQQRNINKDNLEISSDTTERQSLMGRRSAIPTPLNLTLYDSKRLQQFTDAVIIDSYYELRDASEEVAGEARFYNTENLFCTAFEREKDRRELKLEKWMTEASDFEKWYAHAESEECKWWIANHVLARQSLKSCMFCGMCTAVCPAAEYHSEYNPRSIVDAVLLESEEEIISFLKLDTIWYCGQCGSCKERCPRGNSIFGLVTSLRLLAQLKGYHLFSSRGRQQYSARYLWGGNFWNRGCSMYFRNIDKWDHPDFGPGYSNFFDEQEQEFLRLGANPDRPGMFGGRKINPETLEELRVLVKAGGTLRLWRSINSFGNTHRKTLLMDEETYLAFVSMEG